MKLRDIPKRGRAVNPVQFRLANAPLLAVGADADEHTLRVGIRVLRPDEVEEALKNACAAAAAAGVPQWLDTHPLCRLHEMEQVILLACVDAGEQVEPFFASTIEPFFASIDEVKSDDGMSADGVAYLYEQWKRWQDESAGPSQLLTPGDVIAIVLEEAGRPENAADGPFSRLRASTQLRCMRSMAVLLASSIGTKSEPGPAGDNSSGKSSPSKKQKRPSAKRNKSPVPAEAAL